jgi:tellurite resistance protein
MTFRAHQGFVLFRRVTEISGVFCRDHALEAYFAARGATLKGMWFSPSSLVFGTLRSFYDSAKLLDLPDEVRDEPWVPHIVACPNCRQKNVAAAGPVKCGGCGSFFTVASCASCKAVHVVGKAESFADVGLTCRLCGRDTRGPQAVRNWAVLLLVRAIAEASAVVATANGVAGAAEKKVFLAAVSALFGLDETTAAYVGNYFDKCTAGKAEGLLQAIREGCADEHKTLALRVALSVAEADGFVDENDTRALCNLAEFLGLDPNKVYEEINTGIPRRDHRWQMAFRMDRPTALGADRGTPTGYHFPHWSAFQPAFSSMTSLQSAFFVCLSMVSRDSGRWLWAPSRSCTGRYGVRLPQRIGDDRLQTVTEHVRKWLFGGDEHD